MKNNIFVQVLPYAENKPFHAIFSNPPYQKDTGNGATAIYYFFMNIAQKLSCNVSMIYPFRWVIGGRGDGIEKFRNEELISQHYKTFLVNSHEKGVFEHATIKGGVNYFSWDEKYTGTVTYIFNGVEQKRFNLKNNSPVMITDPAFEKIAEKVMPNSFMQPFGVSHYGISSPQQIHEYSVDSTMHDTIKLFYSGKGGGVRTTFIPKKYMKKDTDKFKVIASATADPDGKKTKLRRPGRVFTLAPNEVPYTSFIQIDECNSQKEADRAVIFLKTDFITFLIGIITPTQHCTRSNYRFVPKVNFLTGEILDKGAFLDFDNIQSLNNQLMDIYSISIDERNIIVSSVRPWKDKYSLTADGLF